MAESCSLSTRFDPGSFEKRWYDFWIDQDFFRAKAGDHGPVYSIVIPPPNVTGKLHMGHALVNTLQDIMVRYKRMQGCNTLWLPGTDHAGIATQMVVERALLKEGKTRHDLGREKFLQLMWDWKDKYRDNIKEQLKLLGCSCDWSRERFTLDEGLARAVRRVFVQLHGDGLLYRGRKIVNWCPRCQTALSDLEVEHQEIKGKLYSIAYPVEGRDERVVVATTRPETLLGDAAVAVHPEDERYVGLIGAHVILPLLDRSIPVVADDMVDRAFGTGVVKITPAHDPNDFAVAQRHALPEFVVMDERGVMNSDAGEYDGMDRFEARRAILRDLKRRGFFVGERDHIHAVGHCQRCRTMVEPYLSPQWYVKMGPIAEPAIRAVEEGRIRFTPQNWTRTYYEWMNNIQDWCISRQIWWGHRIPVFHCDDCGEVIVQEDNPAACTRCGSHGIRQEEDVLDTWFSSALWPFSTLGWPDETPDLGQFYPTSCLITGFDILFFWVARMIMMGLYCTGSIPFSSVYLNALVRDAQGQKMSKTRGNVLEPEELCCTYGADAVRFTLARLASPGRDIPLAPERMAGYRAFLTKLWNAARFIRMKIPQKPPSPSTHQHILSRWILSRFSELSVQTARQLDTYRFDRAAEILYHFLWHTYCDWFIELSKPILQGDIGDEGERQDVGSTLYAVLDGTLRLLHPIAPFVTEEIWHALGGEGSISTTSFPSGGEYPTDETAAARIEDMIELIGRIRAFRTTAALPTDTPLDLVIAESSAEQWRPVFGLLRCIAGLSGVSTGDPEAMRGFVDRIGDTTFAVSIPKASMTDDLRQRLEKELAGLRRQVEGLEERLQNREFLKKAPPEVVQSQRERHEEITRRMALLTENIHPEHER